MPASTKTSSAPVSATSRYGALKHLLEGDIPLPVILEAAQALQSARTAQSDQAATSVRAVLAEMAARATQAGSDPTAPARPVTAFHLKRALTRQSAMPPVLDEGWSEDVTRGPADLIRHFVRAAISEFKPEIGGFDDQSLALILEVAEFSADTAIRLAGVPETWLDEYHALTTYLRK